MNMVLMINLFFRNGLCMTKKETEYSANFVLRMAKWNITTGGNMTQGTNQFKKDACDKHVMSATHQKALKFIFSKSKNPSLEVFTSKPLVTSLSQNSNCIDMKKYNDYRNLFMNIYWCCKEELPILKSLLYIILPRRV